MGLKGFLSKSRYVIIVPVLFLFAASMAAFIWGGVKTISVIYHIAASLSEGGAHTAGVELIALMDTFLIATALYIFSIGLYELFIEELDFPEWLVIHDLHSLKAKLASVIVLVMAVMFLERLSHWESALETLMYAGAIALVTVALIAFGHFGGKD